jgi:hypothetical protein
VSTRAWTAVSRASCSTIPHFAAAVPALLDAAQCDGAAAVESHTEFGIRDKKHFPNTVSVLGMLFHKKNSYSTRDVISIIQNGIRDIIPGIFY